MLKVRIRRKMSAFLLIVLVAIFGPAEAKVMMVMTYLRQEVKTPPVLSNLDPIPKDLGIAGAKVALADTQTTGSFLDHHYSLTVMSVEPGGDFVKTAKSALTGSKVLFVDAPATSMLTVADLPEARDALIFNVSSGERRLRDGDCRANLFHTIPEDAMRADALMQVLRARRWSRTAMIIGPKEQDEAFAATLRSAAAKFGVEIVAEKTWTFNTDLRRAASKEVPLFTQDLPDHDVLLVADETDDFARYIADNTWLPRPLAGSDGLRGEGWAPVLEQWGAVQLQNRFEAAAKREMRSRDYAAWAALRTVGEAVTRTNTADPRKLRTYILSDGFALDGFKGRSLSYRRWNGQLRQPMPVVNSRALVDLAPLDGYLHQENDMDTLGLDRAESACKAFGD
jgi:ABC transporter substrate binding protein (PQQ-dependent alcohol dehydrogenase system)